MASLLLVCGAAAAVSGAETAGSIRESIDSLRADALYSSALAQAKKLLGMLPSDTCSYAYELDDTRRLIATLEAISEMPAEAGAELAVAVRLAADCARLAEGGNFEGAAESAERQATILRRHLGERHAEYASALAALAFFRNMTGELDLAERLYLDAIDIQRAALGDHPDAGTTLNNLAALHLDRNDHVSAEKLFRDAIDVFRASAGETHPDEALAYYNLAVLCKGKHDFASAEAFCRQALGTYRRLDARACTAGQYAADVAASLRMLGALYAARGNVSRAESLLQEAERILRELDARFELALTLMDLAGIRQDREFFGAAENLYQQALDQLQGSAAGGEASPDAIHYSALALNNLGDLAHDDGNYEAADSLYERAVRTAREVLPGTHHEIALIQLNRARNYRDWGKYDEALPLYREAAGVIRERLGAIHPYLSRALYSMGNLYFARGSYTEAESLLCEAASIYERSRVRIGSGLDRVAYQNSPYPKLAATYACLGKTDRCWPTFERYLGRYLADLLSVTGSRDLTAAETARQDSLANEIRGLEDLLAALQDDSSSPRDPGVNDEIEKTRLRLHGAETNLATLEQAMASRYPVSEGEPFALERVQRSIPEASAMIGWLDVEEKKGVCVSWVFVIKRSGPPVWRRISPAAATGQGACAARRAEELRSQLSKGQGLFLDRLAEAARAVWLDRFAPIEGLLEGCDHLIIIPSGAMLGIPVEALIDTTGAMVTDRFAVSYAPSGTISAWLAENATDGAARASHGALLCGDPPFSEPAAADAPAARGRSEFPEHWPPLPGTREEITAIGRIASHAAILLGAEASEQRLDSLAGADALKRFRMIHFATHAWIDEQRPERSVLVLSQAGLPDPLECALHGRRIFDGFITAEEILLNWKLDADLVTLSACETGAGAAVAGEGYIGFSHAFFRAGARSIIVSLWKADDKATSLFMQQFYSNYFGTGTGNGKSREPMAKADALRAAKRWLRDYRDESGKQPFGHPFYWANFILVGDHGKLATQ